MLRRREFFRGRAIRGSDVKDLTWLEASGNEMTDEDWDAPTQRPLGLLMDGNQLTELDEHGERISGDTLLMLLNANHDAAEFTLPTVGEEEPTWELLIDTARPDAGEGEAAVHDRRAVPA